MLDEQTGTETKPAVEKLFTDEQFAHLGGGLLAYVKPMQSEEVGKVFPNAPEIQPGIRIFALIGADGNPLLLSDSRDAAVAGAIESKLEMISLH